jgi:transcriptional regulator with XRE-family HTH domain
MTLGTKLSGLRHSKNISQEQLAYELELSKTSIIKWEQDKAKPSIDNLLKLCDFFETNVYTLLQDVSNINFSGAKFKGSSYAGYAQNFTIHNTVDSETLKSILENQTLITQLFTQQNNLIEALLKK